MNLLDLPLELLRAVLAEAMRARTLKRALRLRLVNSKQKRIDSLTYLQLNGPRALLQRSD
jgi:hypothetical protein